MKCYAIRVLFCISYLQGREPCSCEFLGHLGFLFLYPFLIGLFLSLGRFFFLKDFCIYSENESLNKIRTN